MTSCSDFMPLCHAISTHIRSISVRAQEGEKTDLTSRSFKRLRLLLSYRTTVSMITTVRNRKPQEKMSFLSDFL